METNNSIAVHQAFYGEVNQSHGCINSTLANSDLAAFLTRFTDRPGPVPAGVKMEPYYSAAAHGNYYVFTLTFPDYSAKRHGMVFTHALILSLSDLSRLNSLNELFSRFITIIPVNKNKLEVLSLFQSTYNNTLNTFPAFVPSAVERLLSGQSPVVFCGKASSFILLIKAIWLGVPYAIRSKITYTVGFSGTNIDESKTFIHFQPDLKQQLNNRNFVSDELDQVVEITSVQQKYLLLEDKDNGLNLFMEELKVDLNDWSTIQIAARAFESYQVFSNLNNDALKQLIRQIAKISPRPEDGEIIKEKLIIELKKRLVDRSEHNLKSLKNIPLESYQSGERQLQDGIILFIEGEFREESNFNVELISELVILDQTPSENWWYKGVKKSLEKIKDFTNVTQLKNVWKIVSQSKKYLSAIHIYLPTKNSYEDLLLKTVPDDIPEKMAKVLAEKFRIKKWYLLHAHLIQIYLTPKEALLQQFSIEQSDKVTSFTGTESILIKVSDTDLLDLALKTKEDYFINTYIGYTVSKPHLLNDLKTDNPVWLQIWSGSIEKTNILTNGIVDLSEKIEQLLNSVSEGGKIPEKILHAIANSEYADLSGLKNRSILWGHLQPNIKALFLNATANGLIRKDLTGITIEQELIDYIQTDKYVTSLLGTYRSDINTIMKVFEHVDNVNDSIFATYIKYHLNSLNEIQSARLGNLVLSKHLSLTAKQIFEKAKQNSSFNIALTKCQSLLRLGFWDKYIWGGLIGETVSDDSVYAELTQIAVKLYDKGPEENDIWKRAGGETSKLYNHKTREENWRAAIHLLRNGGGGKEISVKSLIKEMLGDHSNNSELKQIIKYFK